MNFSDYLTWDPPKLLAHLGDVTGQLAETETELGYTRAGELQARLDAYLHSPETSTSGRESAARYAAVAHTSSLLELEARVRALTEEKFFLIRVLEFAQKAQ